MNDEPSSLANWTPEQIALGRRWVKTWKLAGEDLERIHRKELRELDVHRAIELLCGPADYTSPPRAPKPTSGLVEQQRLFMKAAHNASPQSTSPERSSRALEGSKPNEEVNPAPSELSTRVAFLGSSR